MEPKSKRKTHQKKPYVKPKVTRVRITPEEVVLGNCKASSHASGPLGTCHLCGGIVGS